MIGYMLEGKIRPITLCIIRDQDRILVMDGYDEIKQQSFFRLLGGGIEFFETSEEALRREFEEELGTDLENVQYVTTLENIFTFNGKRGHEIVVVQQANLKNKNLYTEDAIPIRDSKDNHKAFWKDVKEFKEGAAILYPENILDFIK